MNCSDRRLTAFVSLFALVCAVGAPAHAVIVYSKADRNAKPPAGSLANSGWQWQGRWGKFLGTAVSRRFFLTAEHIGGKVGDLFILNGRSYRTIATYDDPRSDLQLWRIQGDLPSWAPLFKENSEAGRNAMLFGRGTQRGADVIVNGQHKGWLWDGDDGVQSWGKNIVGGAASSTADPEAGGEKIANARLWWDFSRDGVSHEGTISSGDSGGGVFVRVGRTWKLAAVNHSAEAEFLYPGDDPPGTFKGALYDVGGLKTGETVLDDTFVDNPARAYATRVSTRVQWIYDVVNNRIPASPNPSFSAGVPEPGAAALALAAGGSALLSRRRRAGR